jgi:hypothetical protein
LIGTPLASASALTQLYANAADLKDFVIGSASTSPTIAAT